MKPTLNEFDTTMVAAAFAEAGEHESAREILARPRPEKEVRLGRFARMMMAIAFAEAGEHETAREFVTDRKRPVERVRPRNELRA